MSAAVKEAAQQQSSDVAAGLPPRLDFLSEMIPPRIAASLGAHSA